MPVPPVTDVWEFELPSAVATLSETTIRKPISPEVESALVVVVSWNEVPAPEVAAVPRVPIDVIAIGGTSRLDSPVTKCSPRAPARIRVRRRVASRWSSPPPHKPPDSHRGDS